MTFPTEERLFPVVEGPIFDEAFVENQLDITTEHLREDLAKLDLSEELGCLILLDVTLIAAEYNARAIAKQYYDEVDPDSESFLSELLTEKLNAPDAQPPFIFDLDAELGQYDTVDDALIERLAQWSYDLAVAAVREEHVKQKEVQV